jgi:hypothetical protein
MSIELVFLGVGGIFVVGIWAYTIAKDTGRRAHDREKQQRHAIANAMVQEWRRAEFKRGAERRSGDA